MFKSALKFTGVTLLIVVALFLIVNYTLHYLVNNKLNEIINYNSEKSIYQYTFSKAHLNLWEGDIEIHDVKIHPRKSILDSLALIGQYKRIVLDGSLNTLMVKNIDIVRLLLHQEISIDSFLLIKPSIDIRLNTKIKADDRGDFTKDIISQTLSYGKIKFLALENAKVRWMGASKDTSVYFSCDSVSLNIYDLYTDSVIIKKQEPVVFSELVFEGSNFNLNVIKDFSLTARKIKYCNSKDNVSLEKIVFKNTLNKIAFTHQQRFEKEWYSVNVARVSIQSNNTLDWVDGGYVSIDKIKIEQPHITIYRDKRLENAIGKEKQLLSPMIRNLPVPILIDTIEAVQGTIKYQEVVEKGKKAGEISFTNFMLKAHHLTNIDSLLKKHPLFNVAVKANLLGSAPLAVKLSFPIQDVADKFYASGNIQKMEAVALNTLLINMLFIEFKKGTIHSVSFDLTADKERARGTLDVHYSGLKFVILDTTELFDHKMHKNKKVLGFIANTLLKSNNIPGSKKYVQGTINALRPKNKSILNYLWLSIKSGLTSTALNPKLYAKMMNAKKKKAEKTKKGEESAKKE